jgi:hypothetical protein
MIFWHYASCLKLYVDALKNWNKYFSPYFDIYISQENENLVLDLIILLMCFVLVHSKNIIWQLKNAKKT